MDSLKQQVLAMQGEINAVQLNLHESHKKFKLGILAATVGYTVTIAGGLMLGRDNDKLGQALLISGGITGLTGTFLMVDAFKYLDRPYRRMQKPTRP